MRNNKLLRILQSQRLQTPVAHLYWEYQTLPVAQQLILQILSLIYNFLHHAVNSPEVYKDSFIINNSVHSYCTRHTSLLHINFFKRSAGQRSIQYTGSVLWNRIPETLPVPMSKYTFWHKLKLHLSNELHC